MRNTPIEWTDEQRKLLVKERKDRNDEFHAAGRSKQKRSTINLVQILPVNNVNVNSIILKRIIE